MVGSPLPSQAREQDHPNEHVSLLAGWNLGCLFGLHRPISNRSSNRRSIVWQLCRLSQTARTTSFSCALLYKYLQIHLAGQCLSSHHNLFVSNATHYLGPAHHASTLNPQPQPQLLHPPTRHTPRHQPLVPLVRPPRRQGARHVRRPPRRLPQQRALVQLGPRF